jgi:hypothetical protein
MKVQQKKKDFCSSKDPIEDLIFILCFTIVMKDITLWNQYFVNPTHMQNRRFHPCSAETIRVLWMPL